MSEFEARDITIGHQAVWDFIESTLNSRGLVLSRIPDTEGSLPCYVVSLSDETVAKILAENQTSTFKDS